MATIDADVLLSVRRKLNITWTDVETEERLRDVVATVSPDLADRCGLEMGHSFTREDPEFGLFLNACLYEYSDALDDFWNNYAREIGVAHLRNVAGAPDA